jgi:DNA polymerase-3 subunit delta'
LTDSELWSFRKSLVEQLSEPRLPSVSLAQTVAKFVDEAGKDAAVRRARLRQVMGFAAEFYRDLLHLQSGILISDDQELRQQTQQAIENGHNDGEATAGRLDRCLEAITQIERNANQATLIECWLDDLAS